MTKKALILIDGNNLYHNLKTMNIVPSSLDFIKFSDFICANFSVDKEHIIYYNSIPKMTDPTFFKHQKFLNDLEIAGIEVKTRKLQYRSIEETRTSVLELVNKMKLCDKCKPIVSTTLLNWLGTIVKKEKGIDVMMAVDIISNAQWKKYDCCIVISGDADLISAMEFARNKGVKILSAFIELGYSSEIKSNFEHFTIRRTDLLKNCIKSSFE